MMTMMMSTGIVATETTTFELVELLKRIDLFIQKHFSSSDYKILTKPLDPSAVDSDSISLSSLCRNSTFVDNLKLVGSKALKASASQFAYDSYPSGDTQHLTALVANFVSSEHLVTFLQENKFQRDTELLLFLGYATFAVGIESASRSVVAHFREALKLTKETLDIPQLICALHPGISLQGLTRSDRLDLIRHELRERGVIVSEPEEDESVDDDHRQKTWCVHIDIRPYAEVQLTSLGNPLLYTDEQEAREAVVRVARAFREELRVRRDKKGSGSKGTGGGVGSAQDRKNVPVTRGDLEQVLPYCRQILNIVKKVLRFEAPMHHHLEKIGRLQQCYESRGWVPLTDVVEVLKTSLPESLAWEPPTPDFVAGLLDEHDGLQRFEVGRCDVEGSPLHGLRCARSFYAHQRHSSASSSGGAEGRRLYQDILDSLPPVQTPVPPFGWILFDNKLQKQWRTLGYRLHDNNILVSVVQEEHLTAFTEYLARSLLDETTPVLRRVLLDEKIRPNVTFAEVYLGAAACDRNNMTVAQHPKRGDTKGHHVLLPMGQRYTKYGTKGPAHYFPMALLSGRTVTFAVTDTGVERQSRAIRVPPDPMVSFGADELSTLMDEGCGSFCDGKKVAREVMRRSLSSSDGEGAESPSGTAAAAAAAASVAVTLSKLDDSQLRQQIQNMHQDPNQVLCEVSIPRSGPNGGSLFERTKTISDLKLWIRTLGMTYQELPSKSSLNDLLLVRKPQAFPESELERIVEDIGVDVNRALLRRAITRECVHKQENYERLEFIGDAILDFVVAFDAAVVFGVPLGANGVRRGMLQVTADVCRNDVLAELLPQSLNQLLTAQYGSTLNPKTRADMFESLVGAVYDDGSGLDTIRTLLVRLFSQLPRVLNDAIHDPDRSYIFRQADALCPYLREDSVTWLQKDYPFLCKRILTTVSLEATEWMTETAAGASATRGAHTSINTHAAGYGFPRIQDKQFATHFTTGRVYSYRRLTPRQVPKMLQKILTLYEKGDVGFVNETIGNFTTLTFDIDGVDVNSHGVLRLICQWYQKTFPGLGMGLVLDCSGFSVVSKKFKHSCHIHFPQVAVSVEELAIRTRDLRAFLVQSLRRRSFRSFSGTGQIITVGPVASRSTVASLARVVLDMRVVYRRFFELEGDDALAEEAAAAQSGQCAPPSRWTHPSKRLNHVFSFLNLVELMRCAAVCVEYTRQVVVHLVHIARTNPAQWFRTISECNGHHHRSTVEAGVDAADTTAGIWLRRPGAPESMPTPSDIFRSRVVRLMKPRFESFEHAEFAVLPLEDSGGPKSSLVTLDEKSIEDFVAGNAQNFQKNMKAKEYLDTHIKPLLERSVFNSFFWEKAVDAGLVESRKLRMYLNDKCDTVYGQEYRPLTVVSVLHPVEGPLRAMVGSEATSSASNSTSALRLSTRTAVRCFHRQVLEKTSLQSRYVHQVDGNQLVLWDNRMWDSIPPCEDSEEAEDRRVDALLDALNAAEPHRRCGSDSGVSNATAVAERRPSRNDEPARPPQSATQPSPHAKHIVSLATPVTLPNFAEVVARPPIVASDWQVWASGVFSTTEIKETPHGKPQRHAALHSAYWLWRDGAATFYICGTAYLSVAGPDLATCLADGGGGGMRALNRLFTPHISVEGEWKMPNHASNDFLCLYDWERKKPKAPQPQAPVAQTPLDANGSKVISTPKPSSVSTPASSQPQQRSNAGGGGAAVDTLESSESISKALQPTGWTRPFIPHVRLSRKVALKHITRPLALAADGIGDLYGPAEIAKHICDFSASLWHETWGVRLVISQTMDLWGELLALDAPGVMYNVAGVHRRGKFRVMIYADKQLPPSVDLDLLLSAADTSYSGGVTLYFVFREALEAALQYQASSMAV